MKWLPATALVQLLQQARQGLNLMEVMSKRDKYRVMIIDDIGYAKKPTQKLRFCLNLLRIGMTAAA